MRGGFIRWIAACWLALAATQATAQSAAAPASPASLFADAVNVSGNGNRLVAAGNVEVLQGDTRLSASRITYDASADRLTIEGPITLVQGESIVVLADSAALDTDLKNGILASARLILDRRLQLAATSISRVEGRYTQLFQTVASSCLVPASHPRPLWSIRARRVTHDSEKQLLYFEGAEFRVADVPLAYLPRMRMPDPTNKRLTGFLVPELHSSTKLGFGLRVPYFITLGDSADVTLTPFLTEKSRTLELRYRQAFATGNVTVEGSVSRDDLLPGKTRAYAIASGNFALPAEFALDFSLGATADPAYLFDYGRVSGDTLESALSISRTRRDERIRGSVTWFRPLRRDALALADEIPTRQAQTRYDRRFFPAGLGGEADLSFETSAFERPSTANGAGRDVARATARLVWRGQRVLPAGVVATARAALTAGAVAVAQDSRYPAEAAYLLPAGDATLRWPLLRRSGTASELLEPVVQLGWSRLSGKPGPNEDSTLVEFDEANLYALSRFPGDDRTERGLRGAAGLSWTRHAPGGLSARLVGGRVLRATDPNRFTVSSGLRGPASDWLISGQVKLDKGLSLTARGLFGNDLAPTKTETRLGWTGSGLHLDASYGWIIADPAETRQKRTSQLGLDGAYHFSGNWQGSFGLDYDFTADRPRSASLGLSYRNECASLDLSLSRRYTSSTSLRANTDLGLSVSIIGFGNTGRDNPRSCTGL